MQILLSGGEQLHLERLRDGIHQSITGSARRPLAPRDPNVPRVCQHVHTPTAPTRLLFCRFLLGNVWHRVEGSHVEWKRCCLRLMICFLSYMHPERCTQCTDMNACHSTAVCRLCRCSGKGKLMGWKCPACLEPVASAAAAWVPQLRQGLQLTENR